MQNYNPLEKQEDVQVKHAQVVYLNKVMNKSVTEIADITGYVESTVQRYIKKFAKLLEWAKEIFSNVKEKIIDYVFPRKSVFEEKIKVAEGIDLLDNVSQKCYLISFYDEKNQLVCSKVGTTTRTVIQRIKEELRSKTYKKHGCDSVIIHRVYDCKNLSAEGLESYLRALYIKQYPSAFEKNDRFFNIMFDLDQADKYVSTYYESA